MPVGGSYLGAEKPDPRLGLASAALIALAEALPTRHEPELRFPRLRAA